MDWPSSLAEPILFSDISFQINEKDRIALMGKERCRQVYLVGRFWRVSVSLPWKIDCPKDCVVVYLPQHLMTEDGRNGFWGGFSGFLPIFMPWKRRLRPLTMSCYYAYPITSDSYMELIEKVFYHGARSFMPSILPILRKMWKKRCSGWDSRAKISTGRPVISAADGVCASSWRNCSAGNPDVLLLDEPTNHLDIESIQWLEDFLITSAKAVIVISHDRKFVDNIITRTIEVTMGTYLWL